MTSQSKEVPKNIPTKLSDETSTTTPAEGKHRNAGDHPNQVRAAKRIAPATIPPKGKLPDTGEHPIQRLKAK